MTWWKMLPTAPGKQPPQGKFLNSLEISLDLYDLTVDKGTETPSISFSVDFDWNVYQEEPQQTRSKVPMAQDSASQRLKPKLGSKPIGT